jgi:DNA-binding transcriptional regulator YdaS (Cro superfamily)
VYFDELRLLLVEKIRRRVHNGELTERALARLIGISQPHMHNILKGTRSLSPEVADNILYHLRLSVLDLCDPREFERYLRTTDSGTKFSYIPVLRGRIGPHDSWPEEVEGNERFSVASELTAHMAHPVVCRLGEDEAMHPLLVKTDLAMLDQSYEARTEISADGLYLIKRAHCGVIRYAREVGGAVFTYTHGSKDDQSHWKRLPAHYLGVAHYIRAAVTLVAPEREWM